jgi:hypothetical protein
MKYVSLKIISIVLLAIFLTIGILSCTKDFLPDESVNIEDNNITAKIKASVSGFVTNENNLPVQNATVTAGSGHTTTDQFGYFEIKDADLAKNAAFVTIEKASYFKGIKTWIATSGKPAFFRIKLLPKTVAGSIAASAGGIVSLPNGMKLSFPAAAIVDAATNVPYSGTVSVAAQWIDPASASLNNIMPGDLRGIDGFSNLKVLTTYGMAAVELTGSAGQLLQIEKSHVAALSMPIPASLAAAAPASIPLWYFNEKNGLWQEEGSAVKTGNFYVGDVSHFSFWNCDVPANYVQFNCTLVNNSGMPVPNMLVKISTVNLPYSSGYGYANALGFVSGAVPANAQLRMEVFGNSTCSTPLYSQVITTTTQSLSLGNIIIASGLISTITGVVNNCSNNPVVNGAVFINNGIDYNRCTLSSSGAYSLNVFSCSLPHTIFLIAQDSATGMQSVGTAFNMTGTGVLQAPNIRACTASYEQQYINYTIDGVPYSFTSPADTMHTILSAINNLSYQIRADRTPPSASFVQILTAGNDFNTGSPQFLKNFISPEATYVFNSTSPSSIQVNMLDLGVPGGYITGNFTAVGNSATTANTVTISCNFKLRRNN